MDQRKGISAGYKRLGPTSRFVFNITILGLILAIIPLGFYVNDKLQNELVALSGELIPDNKASPDTQCGPGTPRTAAFFLGNTDSHSKNVLQMTIKMEGQELFTLNRIGDSIYVSTKIFSKDGRIIAEIKDNRFHINQNNYFRMERPNKHILIVYDQEDEEILNVEFINKTAMKFVGNFYIPNQAPILFNQILNISNQRLSYFCEEENGKLIKLF